MTGVDWQRWHSPELGAIADRATVVLPVGATEQHGPHLPVGTDALVAAEVARRAAELATTDQHPVLVGPPVWYGASHHHLPRPGTLSLTSDTMLAVLRDLLASAASSGFRRLVVLNGHGGNEDLARQAVRDVAIRHRVRAAATGYWSVAWDELVAIADAHGLGPVPGHAGSFETSLMLAVDPARVSAGAEMKDHGLRLARRHPLAGPAVEEHDWVASLDGYTDPAAPASPEAGREMLDCIIRATADFLAGLAASPAPP